MDKLSISLQETPLTTKSAEAVGSWYTTEATAGFFTSSEFAWLQAQGWRPTAIIAENTRTWYALSRRVVKPENVLSDLVRSYTEAYNEGRQLNDQRYDDVVTIYTSVLDKTEDTFNEQETADETYEALIEVILAALASDYTAYAADVDGDLDTWGTSLLDEVNDRFDAESSKAQQTLIDRGLYSGVMWTEISAGIERERTRALTIAQDQITQRQLELKHKVYDAQRDMRNGILAARDRLRTYLAGQRDRQVAVRNATAEALVRFVERREDGYPDLADIGRLAAGLGAGSSVVP